MWEAVLCKIGSFAAVSSFGEGKEHGADMLSWHTGEKTETCFAAISADELVYCGLLCYNVSHKAFL